MQKQLLVALALATAFANPAVRGANYVTENPDRLRQRSRTHGPVQGLGRGIRAGAWPSSAAGATPGRRRTWSRNRTSAAAAPAAAGALAKESESVTNVQHAGVDEGGIVKLHGDHLVILRRGRLFTVAVNDKQLKPVSLRRRLRRGHRPGRRLVRRDADVGQHHRGDRLQLRARRHRDRPVRDLADRPADLQIHLSPALERLLLVAQLREPADRLQARVLHPALPQSLGRHCRPARSRRCASGARARRRRSSSASRRPRASTAPTRSSIRTRASRCTACRCATSPRPRWTARAPRCSASPGACSTSRPARCTSGT